MRLSPMPLGGRVSLRCHLPVAAGDPTLWSGGFLSCLFSAPSGPPAMTLLGTQDPPDHQDNLLLETLNLFKSSRRITLLKHAY